MQGQEQGAHLADAVGHTDQGLSHAEELAHGQVHPAVAPQGAKVVELWALAAGTGGGDGQPAMQAAACWPQGGCSGGGTDAGGGSSGSCYT